MTSLDRLRQAMNPSEKTARQFYCLRQLGILWASMDYPLPSSC